MILRLSIRHTFVKTLTALTLCQLIFSSLDAKESVAELPALWNTNYVAGIERLEPNNVQHLGISNIDNVEVKDLGYFSAEVELTWEHFESDDSAEQEIELEIEYGISSWLSTKATLPDIWAGPDSKEKESGFDDMGLEFKTLLFRSPSFDIGSVHEVTFPTGSHTVGAGDAYAGENKLLISYFPRPDLAFHLNAGMINEEGDFFGGHIYSLACHWLINDQWHFQTAYQVEGDSETFDEEVDYHSVINFLHSDDWQFQIGLRGEIEDDEHVIEIGSGFKYEFPLGEYLEVQLNLGAFAGLTNETEDWGLRSQLSISY